jgi:hypothetical protein
MRWKRLLVLLSGIGLCACTNTLQSVHVSSDPSGMLVWADGMLAVSATPVTLELDPDRSHELRLGQECFRTETLRLQPVLSKRTILGTLYTLDNQLPPTVHVALQSTCLPRAHGGQ